MFDTVIRNGTILVAGTWVEGDLVVDGGRVAVVLDREWAGRQGIRARQEIDAAGRAVLPGAIDTHAHTRDPGYTHKEDFLTASRAAAVAGVTTIIDMPNVEPPTDTVEAFAEKRARADELSIVDWGHWVAGTHPDRIPELAAAGVTGFKIFQVSGAYPHDPRLAINDDGQILRCFEAIAETGLPCLVHPFNQELFDALSERAFAAGETPDGKTFSRLYTTEEVWYTAVHTLLALQGLSSVRLHLLHTHAAGSLRLIRQAKEQGRRVTCEIDPKYYHLTLADLDRLGGRAVPGGYVHGDSDRIAEIERSLRDGTIDNIATDHAPHTREEVAQADVDAWKANLGSPQLEWVYSLVLTDAAEGRLSVERAVQLLSEGPAKVIGIWPRKGSLLPGSDADLVVVDLDREFVVEEADLQTKVGWSPYAGRRLRGRIELTILRGEVIARDGEVVGEPGYGRYVPGAPD